MDMYGTYEIYENGELIATQSNKLTVLGRAKALNCMLGINQYFATSMGIGISDVPNETAQNYLERTDLDFCVGKYEITAQSFENVEGDTDNLIFTSRITDTSRYTIYEVGLFSDTVLQPASLTDLTLFDFNPKDGFKEYIGNDYQFLDSTESGLTFKNKYYSDTTNNYFRIGSSCVQITGATDNPGIHYEDSKIDFSQLGPLDSIILCAYGQLNSAKTLLIQILDDNNGFAELSYSITSGYQIKSIYKKDISASTNFDWSNIKTVNIYVDSATPLDPAENIYLDGIRVRPFKSESSLDGLVSRAVLQNPIQKTEGSIIDIKYILTMGTIT